MHLSFWIRPVPVKAVSACSVNSGFGGRFQRIARSNLRSGQLFVAESRQNQILRDEVGEKCQFLLCVILSQTNGYPKKSQNG